MKTPTLLSFLFSSSLALGQSGVLDQLEAADKATWLVGDRVNYRDIGPEWGVLPLHRLPKRQSAHWLRSDHLRTGDLWK